MPHCIDCKAEYNDKDGRISARCVECATKYDRKREHMMVLSCLFFPITVPLAIISEIVHLFKGNWPGDSDGKYFDDRG